MSIPRQSLPEGFLSVSDTGARWFVDAQSRIFRVQGSSARPIPGSLVRLGVADDNKVWGVNASDDIYCWDGENWTQIGGKLCHVDVAVDGAVWGVNAGGNVYEFVAGDWVWRTQGDYAQVAVGNAGAVWAVGATGTIYRWIDGAFTPVSGALVQIDVGCDGEIWGVNAAGNVYRFVGSDWVHVPAPTLTAVTVGSARAVYGLDATGAQYRWTGDEWVTLVLRRTSLSVGSDGAVFAVRADQTIQRLAPNGPAAVPGALVQVATGGRGKVWGVNQAEYIYRMMGDGEWLAVGGRLTQVDVGADGTVWGVNRSGIVYAWAQGDSWNVMGQQRLIQVAVGSAQAIWGLDVSRRIFRWTGSEWSVVDGSLVQIDVGADGTVVGVGETGKVYQRVGGGWVGLGSTSMTEVSVGSSSRIVGVDIEGRSLSWNGSTWEPWSAEVVQQSDVPHVHPEIVGPDILTFYSNLRAQERSPASGVPSLRLVHASYSAVASPASPLDDVPASGGTAIDFDGVSDVAACPEWPALSQASALRQIEVWVSPRLLPDDGEHAVLTRILDGHGNGLALQLEASGQLTIITRDAQGLQAWTTQSRTLAANRWSHVTVQWDAAHGDHYALLVDGRAATCVAGTGTLAVDSIPVADVRAALLLGGLPNTPGSFFSGAMSDLRLWDGWHDLVSPPRGRLPLPAAGLLGYWHLRGEQADGQSFVTRASTQRPNECSPLQLVPPPALPHVTLANVPLDGVAVGTTLYLFRQTVDHRLVVDRLASWPLAPQGATQILDVPPVYRGWFAAATIGSAVYLVVGGHAPTAEREPARLDVHHFTVGADGALARRSVTRSTRLESDRGGPIRLTTPPACAISGDGNDAALVVSVATEEQGRLFLATIPLDESGAPAGLGANLRVSVMTPDELPVHPRWYGHLASPVNKAGLPAPQPTAVVLDGGRLTGALALSPGHSGGVYLSASRFDSDGGSFGRRKSVEAVTRDPLDDAQTFEFRLSSLSRVGSLQHGDAILVEAVTTKDQPYFTRVVWTLDPESGYVVLRPGYDPNGAIDDVKLVFGIFKVEGVDESGNVRWGSGAIEANDRVVIVPAAFENPIAAGRAGIAIAPQGSPPSEFNGGMGLRSDGAVLVTLESAAVVVVHPYVGQNVQRYVGRLSPRPIERAWGELAKSGDSFQPFTLQIEAPRGQMALRSGMELVVSGLGTGDAFFFRPLVVSPETGGNWEEATDAQLGTWAEVFELWRASDLEAGQPSGAPITSGESVYVVPTTSARARARLEIGHVSPPSPRDFEIQTGIGTRPWTLQLPSHTEVVNGVDLAARNNLGVGVVDRSLPGASLDGQVHGALLGFARTLAAPSLQRTASGQVRLTFQGNGGALQIGGGYASLEKSAAQISDDYYQEGAMAQSFMSNGGFYSLLLGGARFATFERLTELATLESPTSPEGLVWLVPPPFAASGAVEMVGALLEGLVAPIGALAEPVRAALRVAVGDGTFGQGPYRPFLTLPVHSEVLASTGQLAINDLQHTIHGWMYAYNDLSPRFAARQSDENNQDLHALGLLATALGLAGLQDWKDEVDMGSLQAAYSNWSTDLRFQARVVAKTRQYGADIVRPLARRFGGPDRLLQAIADYLVSEGFLDYIARLGDAEAKAVIGEELYKLSALDPALALDVTGQISMHLLLHQAQSNPLGLLRSLPADARLDGLQRILAAVYDPNGPSTPLRSLLAASNLLGSAFFRDAHTAAGTIAAQLSLATSEADLTNRIARLVGASTGTSDAIAAFLRALLVASATYQASVAIRPHTEAGYQDLTQTIIANVTMGAYILMPAIKVMLWVRSAMRVGIIAGGASRATANTVVTVSNMSRIAGIAGAVATLGLGIYTLTMAVQSHDTTAITFASVNVALGAVSTGLIIASAMGAAAAGPIGVAVGFIALAVALGQTASEKAAARRQEQEQQAQIDRWKAWCQAIFKACRELPAPRLASGAA